MDHSTSSGDDDRDLVRGNARLGEGTKNDGRQNNRQHNVNYNQRHNSRDYDARSHSSQKSDPNSETSVKGDQMHYNPSAASSVGSHGSGGGDSTRGFPLHGHVHFRHAAISATHLLNGDPAHQFPPSLYQPSADAPKSDTATVCSSSMLEDIEDVGSHYDGDSTVASNPKQHHHNYPPPSSSRRSDGKEGSRLVDFAERSQAVFPKQSKQTAHSAGMLQESASASNNDEDASAGNTTQHRKVMRRPLSRHWLMQHHSISPFRTGSVKSGGSTAGSDVVVNVGSDCGGSLTDVQSTLSQEDAALLSTVNSEVSSEATPVTGSLATGARADALDTGSNTITTMGAAASEDDEKKPHPLLCDQLENKSGGRVSPGGTIYRGRGLRRYQGRFYALPLKRFHQGGVHLHSDYEPEDNSITTNDSIHQSSTQQQVQQRYGEDGDNYRWEGRRGGNSRDDYQRTSEGHNYYSHSSSSRERDYNRDRGRSRSRSRSPPAEDRRRARRKQTSDFSRGYNLDKDNRGGSS